MKLMKKIVLTAVTLVLALVAFVAPVKSTNVQAAQPATLYLKPSSNWKQSNARFAAYFFGNGETWVSMTDADKDGIYEVKVPTTKVYPNVIFCRMNPSATANNWNNKWNQTSDLVIPSNGNNFYTVKEGTWDKGGGTWGIIGTGEATYGDLVLGVVGSFATSNWETDIDMTYNKDAKRYEVTMEFAVGDEWKVRQDNDWVISFGWSDNLDASTKKYCEDPKNGNIKVKEAGKYLVWIDNDMKIGMEQIWELAVKVGYQVGTKDEAKALRLVAEFNLDEAKLETFDSEIQFRVTKGTKTDTREVTRLYSSVNPMNGGAVLEGAYYAVLTYTNIPTGEYLVEVLVDGEVAATVTATVA